MFTANKWNISGALIGIFSGSLIATGYIFDGDLMLYCGLFFGLLSSLVLFPVLVITHMKLFRVILWILLWIVFSGLSWYAAFFTFMFMANEVIDSLYIAVISASTVGVTVLFAMIAPIMHRSRLAVYWRLLSIGAVVSICSVALSGGEFDGLMDENIEIIHPLWEACVIYMFVSVLLSCRNSFLSSVQTKPVEDLINRNFPRRF